MKQEQRVLSPFNTEALLAKGEKERAEGRFLQAYENYFRAFTIKHFDREHLGTTEIFTSEEEAYLDAILDEMEQSDLDISQKQAIVQQLKENIERAFGLLDFRFIQNEDMIGKFFGYGGKRWFIARYREWLSEYRPIFGMNDLIRVKGEMIETEGETNHVVYHGDAPALLPICSMNGNNHLQFSCFGETVEVEQIFPKHFNYYRVQGETEVFSEKPMVTGRSILLKRDKDKKALILSIFVDGLSQTFLEKCGWEVMPETLAFFEEGVICTEAYSTADWTYPGVASAMTGLETPKHMMINDILSVELPKEVPLFTEYTGSAGYYTVKIDGDWRQTPNLGYCRGVDRLIYQSQNGGMYGEVILNDAIDQMELMKETNQCVCIGIGDLHDISERMDLPCSVQGQIPLKNRCVESVGTTSVQQSFSENKERQFLEMARRLDRLLGNLYRYIKNTFRKEEVVVGLYADHGQGFMVPEGAHFLSEERSKVAMMFYGGEYQGVCEEPVSIVDYSAILCKMAGIDYDLHKTDANLPVFFGGKQERRFAVTETIHNGNPYEAALHGRKYRVFVSGDNLADEFGRFRWETEQVWIYEKDSDTLVEDEMLRTEIVTMLKERTRHLWDWVEKESLRYAQK